MNKRLLSLVIMFTTISTYVIAGADDKYRVVIEKNTTIISYVYEFQRSYNNIDNSISYTPVFKDAGVGNIVYFDLVSKKCIEETIKIVNYYTIPFDFGLQIIRPVLKTEQGDVDCSTYPAAKHFQ